MKWNLMNNKMISPFKDLGGLVGFVNRWMRLYMRPKEMPVVSGNAVL